MPAIPSWLLEPLWDQFAALVPDRPVYDPAHLLGCHRARIPDRIVFEKLVQVLRFGCSYVSIADCSCSATTIRDRRDEWIKAGILARLKQIALEAYDRMVGLALGGAGPPGGHEKATTTTGTGSGRKALATLAHCPSHGTAPSGCGAPT